MALNGPRDPAIPIKPVVYAQDVRSLFERVDPRILQILQVWLVDMSEATYICCSTPSAWGRALYCTVVLDESVKDEEREQLQGEYDDQCCEDDYLDYRTIEELVRSGSDMVSVRPDYVLKDDEQYGKAMEEFVEEYRGNTIF